MSSHILPHTKLPSRLCISYVSMIIIYTLSKFLHFSGPYKDTQKAQALPKASTGQIKSAVGRKVPRRGRPHSSQKNKKHEKDVLAQSTTCNIMDNKMDESGTSTKKSASVQALKRGRPQSTGNCEFTHYK